MISVVQGKKATAEGGCATQVLQEGRRIKSRKSAAEGGYASKVWIESDSD